MANKILILLFSCGLSCVLHAQKPLSKITDADAIKVAQIILQCKRPFTVERDKLCVCLHNPKTAKVNIWFDPKEQLFDLGGDGQGEIRWPPSSQIIKAYLYLVKRGYKIIFKKPYTEIL